MNDPDRICSRKGCGLPYKDHGKGFYGRRFCPIYELEDKLFKEPVAVTLTEGQDTQEKK